MFTSRLFRSRMVPGWLLVCWSIAGHVSTAESIAGWSRGIKDVIVSPAFFWFTLVCGVAWLLVGLFRPAWLSRFFGHDPDASHYENAEIKISDLVTLDRQIIVGKTFRNCALLGPAVLLPLSRLTISSCHFSVGDPISGGVISMPEVKDVRSLIGSGFIGVAESQFFGCSFHFISLASTPEGAEKLKAGISVAAGVPLSSLQPQPKKEQ